MFKDKNEKEEDSDRDKIQKENGKEYGERKRRAEDTKLTEGDKVYVIEIEKVNKLTPNFNATPHVVEKLVCGDATIRNEETGQKLRRNVIHLKRVEGQWKPANPNDSSENLESLRNP